MIAPDTVRSVPDRLRTVPGEVLTLPDAVLTLPDVLLGPCRGEAMESVRFRSRLGAVAVSSDAT